MAVFDSNLNQPVAMGSQSTIGVFWLIDHGHNGTEPGKLLMYKVRWRVSCLTGAQLEDSSLRPEDWLSGAKATTMYA